MKQHSTLNEALEAQRTGDRSITYVKGKQDQHQQTYDQLYDRALRLLHDFQQAGLTAGNQLIILHKDNQTFIEGFWACMLG
ncbi:MAG: AMP-dependent synthetase, partial [Gammaproteobacteria bacterium]